MDHQPQVTLFDNYFGLFKSQNRGRSRGEVGHGFNICTNKGKTSFLIQKHCFHLRWNKSKQLHKCQNRIITLFFVFKHLAPQSSQTILAKENQTWLRDFTFDMVHLIWTFFQDKFCSWTKMIHRGCDEKDKADHYLVLITKSKICHHATTLYQAFHCKAQNTFKSRIVLGKRIRTVRCKIFTANPLMVIPHQKASFNLILFTKRPIS